MKFKLKTHSGAKKRFLQTASGKVKRKQAFKNHQLRCKSTKQKRHLTHHVIVNDSDMNRVSKMLNI